MIIAALAWIFRRVPEPKRDSEPERGPNEYELFWYDHVLLWVGVWPQRGEKECAAACERIEAMFRARPEFHEFDHTGKNYRDGTRFSLWLRRDTPSKRAKGRPHPEVSAARIEGVLKALDASARIVERSYSVGASASALAQPSTSWRTKTIVSPRISRWRDALPRRTACPWSPRLL